MDVWKVSLKLNATGPLKTAGSGEEIYFWPLLGVTDQKADDYLQMERQQRRWRIKHRRAGDFSCKTKPSRRKDQLKD